MRLGNNYKKETAIAKMNRLGKLQEPFVFIIDFEMEKIRISAVKDNLPFLYNINGFSNSQEQEASKAPDYFTVEAISKEKYKTAYDIVQKELKYGNSFLANLTFPSKIETDLSLEQLYQGSEAKYKLLIPNHCVVFSPESFIQINEGTISSFPMKGTIQAKIPKAREIILADEKEKAEHSTIVDLIRNDLSMIASDVHVEDFRYVEQLENNKTALLQVSSKITGQLEENYRDNLGSILFTLLPAGSISGAPKKKTVEIISQAELSKRGYYTGIFGYFDGINLDSAVMIRYIEETNGQMYFRSGGGITAYSNLDSEYNELIDKINVPLRKHTDPQRENLQSCLPSS